MEHVSRTRDRTAPAVISPGTATRATTDKGRPQLKRALFTDLNAADEYLYLGLREAKEIPERTFRLEQPQTRVVTGDEIGTTAVPSFFGPRRQPLRGHAGTWIGRKRQQIFCQVAGFSPRVPWNFSQLAASEGDATELSERR